MPVAAPNQTTYLYQRAGALVTTVVALCSVISYTAHSLGPEAALKNGLLGTCSSNAGQHQRFALRSTENKPESMDGVLGPKTGRRSACKAAWSA